MTGTIETDILGRLRHCLPRLAPVLKEDVTLHEIGLDSMDTVELLCAVHDEFGVGLTQDEFQPQHRLREVAQCIAIKIQN